jgi:competence protein ComEA
MPLNFPSRTEGKAAALAFLPAVLVASSLLCLAGGETPRGGGAFRCGAPCGVYGDVKAPGVYCPGTGWKAADAVSAAGGALGRLVPEASAMKTGPGAKLLVRCADGECTVESHRFNGYETLALGMKIDINSASSEDLEVLPEIGPALAGRIAEYRAANGPFKNVESLLDVRGVGKAVLSAVADMVTAGPPESR